MGELRWILLGLGALFLAGLALWELRRPRHAARRGETTTDTDTPGWQETPAMHTATDGALDIPDIRAVDLRRDPPIVLLDQMHTGVADEGVQVALEVAVDRPGAAAATPAAPVEIQWPPIRQERILWLRVVPAPAERFSGRALRQALTSCGLIHGPQDIFHWADDSGRVLASAANLVRPGNFDLRTMDTQQYPGLHLFAVLPGPLPPLRAFEELLGLARELAERLHGEVQNETGQILGAAGIAALRESLHDAASPEGEADEADA